MRRFRINLSNRCYHLISRVAHHAYFFDEDERTRFVDFGRRVAEFAAAEIRIDEGWQAANRKGRAAMTRKTYCGNLLWQSGLTLLVPVWANSGPCWFPYGQTPKGNTKMNMRKLIAVAAVAASAMASSPSWADTFTSAGAGADKNWPTKANRCPAETMTSLGTGYADKVVAVDDSLWQGGFSEDWFVNWDKALAEAKKTGKVMLILHDGSDWCPWSKRLKKDVFDKPEFVEFARKNLVLLLLDSPNRNQQRKDQKEHNQLIVRTLSLGNGIPHACVMNVKGEKLGSINGGGLNLDQYLGRLSRIMGNKGEAMTDENVRWLFSEGYASLAAHVAAIRASLPPFNKCDFKAKVTGIARMTGPKQLGKESDLEFLPPETPVEVPFGTVAVFRVEYDFPRGYKTDVTLFPKSCDDGESHSNYFDEKGSDGKNGNGTTYAYLVLRDRGRTCNLKELSLSLCAESEFGNGTQIWTASKIPVNLMFKKNPANTDDEYSSVPSNTTIIFRDKPFDEKSFVPPAVSTSVPKGWMEDFEAAKRLAAGENKFVLVAFTGSDWCKWSKKMGEEVFSKEAFVKEASKKFVLAMIDIPDDDIILSKIAKKQNKHLSKRYSVHCYPTMVILNPNGMEVKRHSGYRKGGPQGYVAYLYDLLR